MSLNMVQLIGNLASDPELKYTPSSKAVCNFSVATNESWVDNTGIKQSRAEFHRIIVWGKLGELCSQYLLKGRKCYVQGSLKTRSWDSEAGKKFVTEIVASKVEFLDSKKKEKEEIGDDGIRTDSVFSSEDIPF